VATWEVELGQAPPGVIRPIVLRLYSVNHRFPSGPPAM
jgi:hypothetical protein